MRSSILVAIALMCAGCAAAPQDATSSPDTSRQIRFAAMRLPPNAHARAIHAYALEQNRILPGEGALEPRGREQVQSADDAGSRERDVDTVASVHVTDGSLEGIRAALMDASCRVSSEWTMEEDDERRTVFEEPARFVRDFEVEITSSSAIANPVIDSVQAGVDFACSWRRLEDGRDGLSLSVVNTELVEPMATHSTSLGIAQPITIELPETLRMHRQAKVALEEDETAWIVWPWADGSASVVLVDATPAQR